MRVRDFQEDDASKFFYLWIGATSEATFATILDLQRTLFYDLKNFNYSEIDLLPLSELYFLTMTGPHRKSKGEGRGKKDAQAAKDGMKVLERYGMVGPRKRGP